MWHLIRMEAGNCLVLYNSFHSYLDVGPKKNQFESFFSSCVTGSYDRTARLFDIETGCERFVLHGHQNAVFGVQYNYPFW